MFVAILKLGTKSNEWASLAKRNSLNACDVFAAVSLTASRIVALQAYIKTTKADSQTMMHNTVNSTKIASFTSSSTATKLGKCIKLETNYRPKHYYDHLPPLPSVHTFKRTIVSVFLFKLIFSMQSKIVLSNDKAFIAYRKSEERHMVERNLKAFVSKSLPQLNFVNYDAL